MLKQQVKIALSLVAATVVSTAYSQGAGAGAEFNRKDRQETEVQRLKNYDKPVYKDPVGNAIIGGGVTGVLKGSGGAAAKSVGTGSAINHGKKKIHDEEKAD